MTLSDLAPWLGTDVDLQSELATELAEDALYAPYLERQDAELRDMRAGAGVSLDHLAYRNIPGLSNEMVERLEAARPGTLAAAARIRGITSEPEVGQIYKGKVVKVMEFGAFVNFFGAKDGLVHISQLAPGRPESVGAVVKEGQEVYVKLWASTIAARRGCR